jgi:hypothetical protein
MADGDAGVAGLSRESLVILFTNLMEITIPHIGLARGSDSSSFD